MKGGLVGVVERATAGVLRERGSAHSVELYILKQNYLSALGGYDTRYG
jgi:hypothetical protein